MGLKAIPHRWRNASSRAILAALFLTAVLPIRASGLQVRKGPLERVLTLSGELYPVDSFSFSAPRLSLTGNLSISYLAPEGSLVAAGDLLVAFDRSEVELKISEFEQQSDDARISLGQREAELEAEHQDLLLGLAEAEKGFQIAQLFVEIDPTLIPRSDAERYRYDYERTKAAVERASERIETFLATRSADLHLLRLKLEDAELNLKRLRSEAERLSIFAPTSGVVTHAPSMTRPGNLQVGDSIWAGNPVVLLPNMEQVEARVFAFDADLPLLREGMQAEVRLDAYPERVYSGSIESISDISRSRSFDSPLKAFQITAPLEQSDSSLMRPGMTVRARISLLGAESLIVPRHAVSWDLDGQAYVRTAGADSARIPVRILEASDLELAVEGDLRPGQTLQHVSGTTRRLAENEEWFTVQRQDHVFTVSGSGTVEAAVSQNISPPPIENMWSFTIAQMAPEGVTVNEGDLLVALDPSQIEKRIREEQAALEKVLQEKEKTEAGLKMQIHDLELALEEARVERERAESKLHQARQFESFIKVQEAELEAGFANRKVELLERKLQLRRRSVDLQVRLLDEKGKLHRNRLNRNRSDLESMRIRAQGPGVVVYQTNWRNEKKQVGSTVHRMEPILALPDLDSLIVQGQVGEADAGKVREGQAVTVQLDALSGSSFRGIVQRVGSVFRRAAYDRPVKVLDLEIAFEEVDPARMRPGMAARLQIETERHPNAIAIPRTAVTVSVTQSFVHVRTERGAHLRGVEVSHFSGPFAFIKSGLEEGEEILVQPPSEEGT